MFLQEFNIFYKINNRINNLFRKPATQKIIIKWPKLALLFSTEAQSVQEIAIRGLCPAPKKYMRL